MPTIQSSLKYNTEAFIKALHKHVPNNIDLVVAVLPSYHHLKKAIFELRKSEEFC